MASAHCGETAKHQNAAVEPAKLSSRFISGPVPCSALCSPGSISMAFGPGAEPRWGFYAPIRHNRGRRTQMLEATGTSCAFIYYPFEEKTLCLGVRHQEHQSPWLVSSHPHESPGALQTLVRPIACTGSRTEPSLSSPSHQHVGGDSLHVPKAPQSRGWTCADVWEGCSPWSLNHL